MRWSAAPDHGFIVLHHEQGISLIPKLLHDVNQAMGIARMQTDARFIENKKRVHQGGAEAGGEVHRSTSPPLSVRVGRSSER